MFLPFRFWRSLFSALGRVIPNRRRRKAAAKRRRSVQRLHRFDALEPRLVLNADAVDDEYVIGDGINAATFATADYAPNLANDAGDAGPIGLRLDANPQRNITLEAGESYSWDYALADGAGGFDTATVRVVAAGTADSSPPQAYVENTAVREQDGTVKVTVRLTKPSDDYVSVSWLATDGSATVGYDWEGEAHEEEVVEEWIDEHEEEVYVEEHYEARTEWYDGGDYVPGDVIELTHENGDPNPFTVPGWEGAELSTYVWVDTSYYESLTEWYDGADYAPDDVIPLLDEYGQPADFIVPEDWPGEDLTTYVWVDDGYYEEVIEWYDGSQYAPGDVIELIDQDGNPNPFTVPGWEGAELTTYDWIEDHYEWQTIEAGYQWVYYPPYYTYDGWLEFAPGETEKQFTLELLNDALSEADETIQISLSNGWNVGLPTWSSGTVTILDDERNPVPYAGHDAFEVEEDGSVSGTVATNDVDFNGDGLTFELVDGPQHGTLALNSDGSFSYAPDADFDETDAFQYRISDGNGFSNVATVTIQIEPVNDAPTLTEGTLVEFDAIDEDDTTSAGTTIAELASRSEAADVDGDVLGIALTYVDETNGTWQYRLAGQSTWSDVPEVAEDSALLLAATARLRFVPHADFNSAEGVVASAQYRAWDGSDGNSDGTSDVDVSINGDATAYSQQIRGADLYVNPINDDPAVADGSPNAEYWTEEDVELYATLPTASDVDGDDLTYEVVSGPTHGQLTLNPDGSFQYTPDSDFFDEDEFVYSVSDGNGGVLTGTVTITVESINDLPTFSGGADQETTEDSAETVVSEWATNIWTGPANEEQTPEFRISVDHEEWFDDLAIDADGTLRFMPAADAFGTAHVTVCLWDGDNESEPYEFTITIHPVEDAPSFTPGGNLTVVEDSGEHVVGWAGDVWVGPENEGQAPAFEVVVDDDNLFTPNGGPTIDPDGTLRFTPAENANGTATMQVRLSDGVTETAWETFTIQVDAENDAPTFTPGEDVTVDEDSGPYSAAWATDPLPGPDDESGQTLNFEVEVEDETLFAADGLPTLDAAGNLTFTPAADAHGSTTVTVRLIDDGGDADTSSDHTFTISVESVNDPPSFIGGTDQETTEDSGEVVVSDWATNIWTGPANEEQTPEFRISADHEEWFDDLAIDADGTLRFTPAADAYGTAQVTVRLWDGDNESEPYEFTITIHPVEDAPSFTPGGNLTVVEDSGEHVVGWAGDVWVGPENEGQAPAFEVVVDDDNLFTPNGGPTIDPDGTLRFTPAENANGTATMQVRLSDGVTETAWETFTIQVDAENDAPTFTPGEDVTVDEDSGAQTVPNWASEISAGPEDESGQTLHFEVEVEDETLFAADGLPTIDADGNLTFTPADDAFGSTLVTARLVDSEGASTEHAFTLTIRPVNDGPSFTPGGDVMTVEDSGENVIVGWASDVWVGPSNEGQSPTFEVLVDDDTLFTSDGGPRVDAGGTLRFTLADDANGSATVQVRLTDGWSPTAWETFSIHVDAENDAPTFTPGADVTVEEDSGEHFALWATDLWSGPADESGQTLHFELEVEDDSLFTADGLPTIDDAGNLRFTPAADAYGSTTVRVRLIDDGGGADTSPDQTFTITIAPVNDAPQNILPSPVDVVVGGTFTFSNADGHAIAVADDAVANATIQVMLTVDHGTLSLATTAGLTLLTGDGLDDWFVCFQGTPDAVNTALDGLRYDADASYLGAVRLTLVSQDFGGTGAGAPEADVDVLTFRALPALSIADPPAVNEADGAVTFTVTLSHASAETVTVDYATRSDSADDSDYAPTSGTLTFAPGETTKTIAIELIDDGDVEEDESFFMDLSQPTNAFIAQAAGEVVIVSDDVPTTVTVTAALTEVVEGAATAATVTFSRDGDASFDLEVFFSLSGSADVDVDYEVEGAAPESSYSVIIPAGASSTTIDLRAFADGIIDPQEVILITILEPGDDSYVVGASNETVVSIVDVSPQVTVSANRTTIDEGGEAVTFTFTRNGDELSEPLTVRFTTSGTAIENVDYQLPAGFEARTIVIPAGQASVTIAAAALIDDEYDLAETLIIAIEGTDDYVVDGAGEATVTITSALDVVSAGGGAAPTAAAINPQYDASKDQWGIRSITVVSGAGTYDLSDGELPHVRIVDTVHVNLTLSESLPPEAIVEITWAADDYHIHPVITETQDAAPSLTFEGDFSGTEAGDRLPSQWARIRVTSPPGGDFVVYDERRIDFVIDWPEGHISIDSEALTFDYDSAEPIYINFDVDPKLQQGHLGVIRDPWTAELVPPYLPNPGGEIVEYDEDTGAYKFIHYVRAPGSKTTYVAVFGGVYQEFEVSINEKPSDFTLQLESGLVAEGHDRYEFYTNAADGASIYIEIDDQEIGEFYVEVDWGDGTQRSLEIEPGHEYRIRHFYDDGDATFEVQAKLFRSGSDEPVAEFDATLFVENQAPRFTEDADETDDSYAYADLLEAEIDRDDPANVWDEANQQWQTVRVHVKYAAEVFDPGLLDGLGVMALVDGNQSVEFESSVPILDANGNYHGSKRLTVTAVVGLENVADFDGPEEFNYLLPGFEIGDEFASSWVSYFFPTHFGEPGEPTDPTPLTFYLDLDVLDAVAGEPLRLPDGTTLPDPAVVRITRSARYSEDLAALRAQDWVEVDGVRNDDALSFDTLGDVTVSYHLESIDPEYGAAAGDWTVSGTLVIPDGSRFFDLVLTPVDDEAAEWNERFRLVIDDWTDRAPDNPSWMQLETEILLLDNDVDVVFGSNNVDTRVTGLARDVVETPDGRFVSLYDGDWYWVVPFDDGVLPALYRTISNDVVNTIVLPAANGPSSALNDAAGTTRLDIAIASADRAASSIDDELTLRRNFGGVSDMIDALQDSIFEMNPNPQVGDARFGFVDRLVPVETDDDGVTPLLGFLLLRRDGTSAWYAANPTGDAETAAAETASFPAGRGYRWTFDDLESDRFYQITLPPTTLADNSVDVLPQFELLKGRYVTVGAQSRFTPYGSSLGFVVPDANNEIEFRLVGEFDGEAPSLSAYDEWTFVTPDGSRSPDGTSLATLESVTDGGSDARLVLTTKFGDRFEFDGLGLLRGEEDRLGNRTEYDYEPGRSNPADPVHRLTSVTYQSGRSLELRYTTEAGFDLYSIIERADGADKRVTLVSEGTLISLLPSDDGSSTSVHASASNPLRPGAEVPLLGGGRVGNGATLAPTGQIGRLADGLAADDREAGVEYIGPGDESVEASPGRWTYQFDRFGLTTAKAAPVTPDNPDEDVWIWERDSVSGFLKKVKSPNARGAEETGEAQAAADGFDETNFERYDELGNLEKLVYADGTYEEWSYGAHSQVESYRDRNGNTWSYGLNDDGTVASVADPRGSVVTYAYVSLPPSDNLLHGLVETITDEGTELVTKYEYYGPDDGRKNGLVKRITYGFGSDGALYEMFDYDEFGHKQEYVDVDRVRYLYRSDKLGQLLEERIGGEVHSDGTLHGGILVAKYTYDAGGNLRTKSVPTQEYDDHPDRVAVTVYEYDALNRLKSVTEAGAADQHGPSTTAFTYCGDGLVRTVTDAAGHVTTYQYDERRQLVRVIESGASQGVVRRATGEDYTDDTETTFHYDALGQLWSQIDTLGRGTLISYDADGRQTVVRTPDPDGAGPLARYVTRFEYDDNGNVVAVYTPSPTGTGEVAERRYYDDAGRLVRIQGPKVSQPTGPDLAQFTAYEYYADGTVKYERRGVTTANPTGPLNPPTSSGPLDGQVTGDTVRSAVLTEYDVVGRVKKVTTTFVEPGGPRTVEESIARTFDANGLLVETHTDAKQNETKTYYNEFGQVTRIEYPVPLSQDATGAWLPAPVTKFTYYLNGLVQKQIETHAAAPETDANARVTAYAYDALGRVLTTTVVGPSLPAAGLTTTFIHDHLGRVVKEVRPNGSYTEHFFNINGQEFWTGTFAPPTDGASTPSLLATIDREFDEVGLLVHVTDPYGDETFYELDGLDRLVRKREPDYSFVSDTFANWHGEKVTSYVYLSSGILDVVSAPMGVQTKYRDYDALGRATRILEDNTGSASRNTWYTFDVFGNVVSMKDPDGNVTTYEYDGLGRVIREGINLADPSSGNSNLFRTYEYDANGNLARVIDRNGRLTVYEYDNLNRRKSETAYDAVSGNQTYRADYKYDSHGRLNSAEDANSRYVYSNYDALGRAGQIVQTIRVPGEAEITTTFTYDYRDVLPAAERQAATARSGYTVTAVINGVTYYANTYQFDALGREVWAEQVNNDALAKRVVRTYAPSGAASLVPDAAITPYADRYDRIEFWQPVQSAVPNPSFARALDQYVFYERQDAGLVRRIDVRAPSGLESIDVNYQYNYDQKNLLRRYVDRGGAVQSTNYDAFGRLDANHDGNPDNDYTANGNPAGSTGAYNRPTSIGGKNLGYSAEGNVLSAGLISVFPNGSTTYGESYDWDSRNRLVGYSSTVTNSVFGSSTTNSEQVDFYYDVFNNLIGKHVTVDTVKPDRVGDVELYVLDGGKRTLHFKFESGSTTAEVQARNFFSAAGVLYAVDAHPVVNGNPEPLGTHWLIVDRQGNVRDMYRFGFNETGAAVGWNFARFEYEDWGAPKPLSPTNGHEGGHGVDANLLRQWQGAFYDADLGAYKFGDRWMSTTLARWLSEDPSGLRYGPNPFEALNNSPHNYCDPTGHFAPLIWAALSYIGWSALSATADTAAETAFTAGAAELTGDDSDWNQFSVGWSFTKNFGVNLATAGFGGKVKGSYRVAQFLGRQLASTGADTALDVGYYGRDFTHALAANAVGNLGGTFIGSGLSRAFTGIPGNVAQLAVRAERLATSNVYDSATKQLRTLQVYCFAPETPVSTPEGFKTIGEIRRGDRVLAFEFESASWSSKEVLEWHENIYEGPVVGIETDGGTVRCTTHHPFWVVRGRDLADRARPRELAVGEDEGRGLAGRWVNSHELRAGDVLIGQDGQTRTVRKIQQEYRSGFVVHNLTIADDHTFAVGTDAVLVHNTSGCPLVAPNKLAVAEAIEMGELSIVRPARIGATKGSSIHEHHVFPQDYEAVFKKRGIDVHDYTVDVPVSGHQAIHGGGDFILGRTWQGEWNAQIMRELKQTTRAAGRRLTPDEMVSVAENLMSRYGISGDFHRYSRASKR